MSRHSNADPLLGTRALIGTGVPQPVGRGARPSTPESLLVLAVLEDAVRAWRRCAGQSGRRAATLRAELRAWFLSDALDSPFAFAAVCEHLDLNPTRIRRQLGLTGATPLAA